MSGPDAAARVCIRAAIVLGGELLRQICHAKTAASMSCFSCLSTTHRAGRLFAPRSACSDTATSSDLRSRPRKHCSDSSTPQSMSMSPIGTQYSHAVQIAKRDEKWQQIFAAGNEISLR